MRSLTFIAAHGRLCDDNPATVGFLRKYWFLRMTPSFSAFSVNARRKTMYVREHNYLPRLRLDDQTLCNIRAPVVVQRRDRVIKENGRPIKRRYSVQRRRTQLTDTELRPRSQLSTLPPPALA